MIQGHTIDALLAPAFRVGPLFRAWTFTRGLTSTAFLFTAGFAFAVVTADPKRVLAGRQHRLRRGAQLVFVGYLLHAPASGFFGTPWPDAWHEAQIVDVLQCIGVSLWSLELLGCLLHRTGAKLGVSLLLASTCFLLFEASGKLVPQGPFAPLLHYLTARGGSLFPLVPWSGYLLTGYALGVASSARWQHPSLRLPWLLAASAGALLTLSGLLSTSERVPAGTAFCLFKLGLVVAASAALAFMFESGRRLPVWLERLSGETLFLYVTHVVILYATGLGLGTLIGRTLTPFWALASALAFVFACSASALAYRRALEALRQRKGGGRPPLQRIGSRGETENHIS